MTTIWHTIIVSIPISQFRVYITQFWVYISKFWVCLNPNLTNPSLHSTILSLSKSRSRKVYILQFWVYILQFWSHNFEFTYHYSRNSVFFSATEHKKNYNVGFHNSVFFSLKIDRKYLSCEIKMLKLLKLFN